MYEIVKPSVRKERRREKKELAEADAMDIPPGQGMFAVPSMWMLNSMDILWIRLCHTSAFP